MAERTTRIASLDLMRGVVMVLMAIDHVRVYSGLPAGGDTAGIFLTRWITYFVAWVQRHTSRRPKRQGLVCCKARVRPPTAWQYGFTLCPVGVC